MIIAAPYKTEDSRFFAVFTAVLSAGLLAASLAGCASAPKEILHSGAPALLAGVTPDMNSPGFWISAHPAPDAPVLDGEGIARLNERTRTAGLIRDLAQPVEKTGVELKKDFQGTIDWISKARIYRSNGKRVSASFMKPIVEQMNLDPIPAIVQPRSGFIAERVNCRVLPTNEGLFDEPGDVYIDNLQASSLEPGTAALVLHASADEAWLYILTELISGWIPSSSFAEADRETFLARYSPANRLTVVAARADIWGDENKTVYSGYLRMGSSLLSLPDSEESGGGAEKRDSYRRASIPGRSPDGSYMERIVRIRAEDVTNGVLPYTARNIYTQAFKLLHAPYGWGGLFGERDCSQFLCEVFSTVGIVLPRNSSKQAQTGTSLEGFAKETAPSDKKALLASGAIPGATLLRLPGHIMLYLGSASGEPMVIHSTWAYREPRGRKEIIRMVNRTVVSSLRPGSGTKKGSHLERLTTAAMLIESPERSAPNDQMVEAQPALPEAAPSSPAAPR